MKDPTITALKKWVEITNRLLIEMVQGIAEDNFCRQPSPVAPPIGWHIWHVARSVDTIQARISDTEQIWIRDEMVTKFNLDPTTLGLGQNGGTMTHEDAARLPSILGKDQIISYAQAVFDLLSTRVGSLSLDDLQTLHHIRDDRYDSVLEQIIFHTNHGGRHLGMIEALIGVMFDREGTASV